MSVNSEIMQILCPRTHSSLVTPASPAWHLFATNLVKMISQQHKFASPYKARLVSVDMHNN